MEQPQLAALLLALGFALFFALVIFLPQTDLASASFVAVVGPSFLDLRFLGQPARQASLSFSRRVDNLGGLGRSTSVAVGGSSLAGPAATGGTLANRRGGHGAAGNFCGSYFYALFT